MHRRFHQFRTRFLLAALGAAAVAAVTFVAPLHAATISIGIVEPNYDQTDTWTFDPGSVTVKVGDTVTWTNKGSDPHDVTADDKSFVSGPEGNLNPGDTFSFTFAKAGTFTYICTAHPWMHGTIVVE